MRLCNVDGAKSIAPVMSSLFDVYLHYFQRFVSYNLMLDFAADDVVCGHFLSMGFDVVPSFVNPLCCSLCFSHCNCKMTPLLLVDAMSNYLQCKYGID